MRKHFFALILLITLAACKQEVAQKDLPHLNGYWEIEQVTFPDGSEKKYTINTSIDYIEVTDRSGYRKKMQPTLQGTFDTSNDSEAFTIQEQDGSFLMRYKTPLSEWEEKITELTENRFTAINQDGIRYHYKRYEPLNLP